MAIDKFGWDEEARHVTRISYVDYARYEAPGLEEKLLKEKAYLQVQVGNLQRALHEAHTDLLRANNRAIVAESKLRIIEREGL